MRTKTITRAQALKKMSTGADPNQFLGHSNYHCRKVAWTRLGKPLPTDPAERAKFLAGIRVKA